MQLTEQNNLHYRNAVTSLVTKEAAQCDRDTPLLNIRMNKISEHSDARENIKKHVTGNTKRSDTAVLLQQQWCQPFWNYYMPTHGQKDFITISQG